jgi:hypothetical protein
MRRHRFLNGFAIVAVLLAGAWAPLAAQDLTITNVRIIVVDTRSVDQRAK